MICEQTRLLMFLCRNHSEIQIFQVHFSVFQLYLMCFLNFQKCSHLSDSRGKEWAGILMDVKVFSSVLCLLRIPPASSFKWDPAGSSLPQSTKVGKRVCPSVTGGIFMHLFRFWNHCKPSFTVSLLRGIKVKSPTKTRVIQQACGFLEFHKSRLDSLWCFYFLNYFFSTPV